MPESNKSAKLFPSQLEEKIIKSNRLSHFISEVSKTILRATGEGILFKKVCQIALDTGKFSMAWFGIINRDTKILEAVIHEGGDIDFFSKINIAADKNVSVENQLFISAILEGKSVVSNEIELSAEPWRTEALKRGYLSAISIPVKRSGNVIGAFNLYKDTKHFFGSEEIALLEETVGNISFALDAFGKEAMRKKAEQTVVESGRHYETLAEMSPVGIFHTDATGYTTYVNPRWCHISGLSFEEALGNGWLKAVHADDKEKLMAGWVEATKELRLSISEYRFVHPDGTIAWVMGQAVPEINSVGEVVGYIGTITDITSLS